MIENEDRFRRQGKEPVISVIVAVFNGARTLRRCIDSVVEQTYPNKELIIVDGGSKDGTVDILEAEDGKIAYWESKPDRGLYHAFNKALDHATGEWIMFLGSDDYFWEPDVLERAAPYLDAASDAGIRVVYGQAALLGWNGEVREVAGEPWSVAARKLDWGLPPTHGATLHHRNLFKDYGRFDESFRISGDYDFLLRELGHREATFIPGLIVIGMGGQGLSSHPANELLIRWESVRARRNNGKNPFPRQLLKSLPKLLFVTSLCKIIGVQATYSLLDLYRVFTGRPRRWSKILLPPPVPSKDETIK
jgi:glycosyltransferase involved in cell wall biosynthesis